jgi:glycosyltransferase involved in cell wall biosynthesis
VIAVDDGSSDSTYGILKEKATLVLQHTQNMGYGAALKTGIRAAQYRHVAILDADGTYAEEDLLQLIHYMGDYDMVVGARVGKDIQIPWIRRPAKWILNKLANFLTETKIPDLNSGMRIFDKQVVKKFFTFLPPNFSFTTTITIAMLTNGYRVKYVPTHYKKRKGKSKIRPIQDTMNFFALIIRTALYFRPTRIFIPLSLLVIGLSLMKMILIDILLIQNLTDSTLLLLLTGLQIGIMGLLADLIHKRSIPTTKEE